MKIFVTILILFFGLTYTGTAAATLMINGLPSTVQVGDTLLVTASGGTGPYLWNSSNPSSITVTQIDSNTAYLIVLASASNVTIDIVDVVSDTGNQNVSAFDFMTRIGNSSFTDGDTVLVPIYYTNKVNSVGLLSADIFLPYDTTVFKYIGFDRTGTLTNSMLVSSNYDSIPPRPLSDTIKFAIATGTALGATSEQVFLWLRFVSKTTVVASQTDSLHFTKFIVNETINGAFIDGLLTVNPIPNRAPVFSTLLDTIPLVESINFSFVLDATDADSDLIQYSANPILPGMTIDPISGLIDWTPTYNQAGIYTTTFKAKDSSGAFDSNYVMFVVENLNRPPVFTTVLPNDTIAENQILSFNYTATDPDLDSLQFILLTPFSGMTISSAGNFQWQPSYTQAGVETVIVMVHDYFGGIALDTLVITITDVNNPPMFTVVMPDTAIARFDTLRFHYLGFDPESQSITFSLQTNPLGATMTPAGDLQWSPPVGSNGIYSFVVQLDDSFSIVYDTIKVKVVRFGDVSENGTITSFDAGLILRQQVSAITLDTVQKRVGNVSGDSSITSMDASYILQYVVGIRDTFPGGLGKISHQNAVLSAFSFKIVPSETAGDYDLFVSINKPSQVFGMTMSLRFDSTLIAPKSMKQTELTDSMAMSYFFPKGKANLALAGIKPMNTAGNIAKFTFTLKKATIATDAVLFTMDKFVLNEKDFATDIGGIALSVKDGTAIPTEYALDQNFPNPFNPATTINYQLPNNSHVIINVYNLLGQLVATLMNDEQSAGYHFIKWNGTDSNNKTLSSGVYLYKIMAQSQGKNVFVATKKMMLLK